ncbi:MAG: phospholipase D-like domain-containing protein [Burkholderiaceae bacterium]
MYMKFSDISRSRSLIGCLAVMLSAVGFSVLCGCNSLPMIIPDLARPAAASMAIEGARGPLSAQQSKIILEGLRRNGKDLDVLGRHLALEEAIVGTPLSTGNQVTLLQDGPATYRAMYAAILEAKDHINMETYAMDDDEVGQRFAQILIEKQQQGIQVNLIRDSAGTLNTPNEFFQKMTDRGVNVLEFNPLNPLISRKDWTLNHRDHRKLLIVDGSTAFLGGINISSVYSGGSFSQSSRKKSNGSLAWRDTDLQLKGPVVAEFQKLFLSTWEKQKGQALAPKN